jgi:Na+-driven multidrug efflux pump
MLWVYISYLGKKDENIKKAWFLPDKSTLAISGLREFMNLGLPSIGSLCLDWWSFELVAMFAAGLSIKSAAV